MNPKCGTQLFVLPIETPEGKFIARYSEKGLSGLEFPDGAISSRAKTENGAVIPRPIRNWHRTASRALARVLAGKAPEKLPPLDLSSGTNFQRCVWKALQKIMPGQTRSYGEVARRIGRPKAVRAVGGACGANPIPVLIPCHRVLAANRKPGGFSGGLDWKRTLLAREGFSFAR
jgi:O-6-methylguanine DNA methyltransferase